MIQLIPIFRKIVEESKARLNDVLISKVDANECYFLIDGYDTNVSTSQASSKYLGVYVCVYGNDHREPTYHLLGFRNVCDGKDETYREGVRMILEEYQLENHFDRRSSI